VIGAAVSKEFAEREKAKAAKKTATPRPGVDGWFLAGGTKAPDAGA
jgi:hypothetical protein